MEQGSVPVAADSALEPPNSSGETLENPCSTSTTLARQPLLNTDCSASRHRLLRIIAVTTPEIDATEIGCSRLCSRLSWSIEVSYSGITPTPPRPSPKPPAFHCRTAAACDDIFLSCAYIGSTKLPPTLTSDPTHQPYKFQSTLVILNNGLIELKSWMIFVVFQHNEYLVFVSKAVLTGGTSLPAGVGNGTNFAGYPNLKTAIEITGDMT
ncbi:hypothetical protein U1Q18_023074 [Sarracenia purpurea var. burkii]